MFMEKLKMGGNGKSFFALLGKTVDIKNPHHSEFVEKPIWLLSDQRHPEAVMKKACLLIFCSTSLYIYHVPVTFAKQTMAFKICWFLKHTTKN